MLSTHCEISTNQNSNNYSALFTNEHLIQYSGFEICIKIICLQHCSLIKYMKKVETLLVGFHDIYRSGPKRFTQNLEHFMRKGF